MPVKPSTTSHRPAATNWPSTIPTKKGRVRRYVRGPPYLRTVILMSQAKKIENQMLFITQPVLTAKPSG